MQQASVGAFFTLNWFFLPVDTQHNQCPCRFFNPRKIQVMRLRNYATEIPRCYNTYQVPGKLSSRRCNVMSSYWTWQSRHTHSMKEKKRNNDKQTKNRERKMKKGKKCRASPQDMWRALKKKELLLKERKVDNGMTCHRTGYDRHDIRILWKRENRKKQKNQNNKRKNNRKGNLHYSNQNQK